MLYNSAFAKIALQVLLPVFSDGNKYRGGIYQVFEYMDHDLAGLTAQPGLVLTPPQIKVLL